MVEARLRAGPAGGNRAREDELEVRGLPSVSHVHDPVGALLDDAVPDSGHVGRVVAVTAVRLDNDEWVLVLGARGEDELGTPS